MTHTYIHQINALIAAKRQWIEAHGSTPADVAELTYLETLKLRTKVLVIAALTLAMVTTAQAAEVRVPFLQAAIFFMFGAEEDAIQDVSHLSDQQLNLGIARNPLMGSIKARAIVKATVATNNGKTSEGTWEVTVRENDPCTIHAALIKPEEALNTNNYLTGDGNGGRRIEFNKMPSPRAFQYTSGRIIPGMVANMYAPGMYTSKLPHETWCSYRSVVEDGQSKLIRGSSLCRTEIHFSDTELDIRRFKALDYIRANYCSGQPEPLRKPF